MIQITILNPECKNGVVCRMYVNICIIKWSM